MAEQSEAVVDAVEVFIAKWQGVTASELSTSQSFLIDLCQVLDVERPHATDAQDYMFERPITFRHGDGSTSAGRIDLYRRGAFVLESKKLKAGAHTKGFDDAMLRARSQAEGYARALPASEGRPPFVVVVDVGRRIELYAEFSRSGATYTPFPDPRSHRIALADLRDPAVLDRLRRVWADPLSLDPSRASARVTREIADRLATLARSLEASGHPADTVAQFLMRCLFTMFAEDVRLLPEHCFRDLLAEHRERPDIAMRMVAQLWRDMDAGADFSAVIKDGVLRFNGKLFKTPDVLPLDADQLALLHEAARADWKHVEPAIFGTLLERALSPGERHKLGAHYTPRAYVERLVLPTVIEPLREEWSATQAAALTLDAEGQHDAAVAELLRFHHRLCTVRVLDPACGSGNFLYVTLEHLKRLEGEVLNALDEFGHRQTGLALGGERADATAGETVDPHNLLGIEINPRAAAIAEVVLWIGYLQWHFRTRGDVSPPVPVIRDFRNIENRDAVLAYDRVEYVLDDRGVPVTRWDGTTMKPSPVTGEPIPDETARVPVERYVNPRKAAWPEADFVVGNPPFIGTSAMRRSLGDGYTDALRASWPEVGESSDFVMYWWHHAAALVRANGLRRFGLITTNSLKQAFNRKVVANHTNAPANPLQIVFAVPDHPWVDGNDGAAVRIAMTVAAADGAAGTLALVTGETATPSGEVDVALQTRAGVIHADLTVGPNTLAAIPLTSNKALCYEGVKPHGKGFLVPPDKTAGLGLGSRPFLDRHIRKYLNGKDLTESPRGVYALDFYGLTAEELADRYPEAYQWLFTRVKPERDQNNRRARRENWWLFGENYPKMRRSLSGLHRYIATVKTAKFRVFHLIPTEYLHDSKLIAISSGEAHLFGVLSSVVHDTWAFVTGSRLGVGNDPTYVISRSFDCFPFPDTTAASWDALNSVAVVDTEGDFAGTVAGLGNTPMHRVRDLAEQLDAHRQRQQATHPNLTITSMYNVLEKLRSGEPLTPKKRATHEQGLVSVLRQLHDELDAAVLDAYGWSDLTPLLRVAHSNDAPAEGQTREDAKRAFDEAVLERLVALNAERAAEEARGLVRWLRPEFQNPGAGVEREQEQATLDVESADDDRPAAAPAVLSKPAPWPKDPVEQVRAVADVLAASAVALSPDEIAARFTARGPWKKRLPQLLDMLVAVGRTTERDGRYEAR